MEASILIVGGTEFITRLLTYVRQLEACTVETATNSEEAIQLIQAQQPDLVILPADEVHLQLCSYIKEQKNLAWIYCLLVDSVPQLPLIDGFEIATQAVAEAEALERGADAYLLLSQNSKQSAELQQRLFIAHIRAGFRLVLNHRELMRTNDILSAIALSDPLTELNNRRALDWELPRQIQNARLRSEALSLLMLDVDYFKSINDTYGHPVGDLALKLLSARLRHNLRFHDTLFRYGGEEFVIILRKTDRQEAYLVARRLCQLISSQPFAIDDERDLHITISAGTASLEATDDTKGMSLLQKADQNLLRAKSAGRNCVVGSVEAIPYPANSESGEYASNP
jgi:two-component system, cell cycle response regulator